VNATRIFGLVTAIVIAAILGLGWLLGLSPLLNAASQADEERALVEQNNLAQQATLAGMKADFERLDEIEAEIEAFRVAIPNEVDSDLIYDYLARIQGAVATSVEKITTGEAVPYGQVDSVPADDGGDPSQAPVGVAQFDGLYTVPVTIDFLKGTPAEEIIAFAGAMQNGPRIFLVTAITRPVGSDASAGTITAYMFVLAERDDTPGVSAGDHDPVLDTYTRGVVGPWGKAGGPSAPSPTPSETGTPAPSDSPSPTPTPTP
jgi:hypothetical protein